MNNGEIHLDLLVLNSIDLNQYMLSFFISHDCMLFEIKDYEYFSNKKVVNKKA